MKKPKKLSDSQFERMWDDAVDGRANYDWKWFVYDLWVYGHHYVRWDQATQQITTAVPEKGHPKIVINKIYTTLRSVRNFVLRNRPKAEVTPEDMDLDNLGDAVKATRYLDYLHDKLKLRRKEKESVWHALKCSVGFWQVLWNQAKKEIDINVIDPYDWYPDPVAKNPEDIRYGFLAVRRNIVDVENDPKYREYIKKKKIELKPDGKLSASSMKERLMQLEKAGGLKMSDGEKKGTIIVRELWYKEYDENGNDSIKIMAKAGETTIRESEETDLDRIPVFRLSADIQPLSMYGEGWVKNMISPQKLLNQLESQVAEYNDLMNRGRFVTDKGAGVRVIYNTNGQIIEKKRGFDVVQQAISPLSAAIFEQIQNVTRYIEDIGGAHDATLGRIPTGAKSGKAMEALQVGDSNNLSELIENLEDFLEEVYEYILTLVSQKYQFVRRVVTNNDVGEKEFIDVIGSGASSDVVPDGALVVKPNNVVDVKISSWLAETAQARQEALIQLFQLQAIDQETLLKGYAIGNVAQVVQNTMKQKAAERAQETAQQVIQANAQNQNNQQPQEQPAGSMQANAALQAVIQGQQPEVPQGVGPDFLKYIDQFMQSQEFAQLDPNDKQKVQAFRNQVAMSIR